MKEELNKNKLGLSFGMSNHQLLQKIHNGTCKPSERWRWGEWGGFRMRVVVGRRKLFITLQRNGGLLNNRCMSMFQKCKWGMIGLCALGVIVLIYLSALFLLPMCNVDDDDLLFAVAIYPILSQPFISGIPAVVSLFRHERPLWPALVCLVCSLPPLYAWTMEIYDHLVHHTPWMTH